MSKRMHGLQEVAWYKPADGCTLGIGMLNESVEFDFDQLWGSHPEEHGEVIMMGRKVKTPRWQQSYDLPYSFSGMNHEALPLPEPFLPFSEWADSLGYGPFNQKLVNWYENGHHYIGPHSDDVKQLVPGSPIISISLGAERKFRLRPIRGKGIVGDFMLPDRCFVIMGGNFQKHLKHEIVKVAGKKGLGIGRRVNITFRQFE